VIGFSKYPEYSRITSMLIAKELTLRIGIGIWEDDDMDSQ
jgi:hypothetical protein